MKRQSQQRLVSAPDIDKWRRQRRAASDMEREGGSSIGTVVATVVAVLVSVVSAGLAIAAIVKVTPVERFRNGDGPPPNSLGTNGDYYLDNLNGDLYQKQNNIYVLKANLQGPSGPPGAPGNPGTDGINGTNGVNGTQGAVGPIGPTGQAIGATDLHYWSRTGATSGTQESLWYTTPISSQAWSSGVFAADTAFAIPFIANKNGTLDGIAVTVTATGTTTARLGIYNNGNMYPTTLVVDAGTFATTSNGFKNLAISVPVVAGSMYWLVYNCAANPANLRRTDGIQWMGMSPVTSLTAAVQRVSVAMASGAFPATFPITGTYDTAQIPLIFVHYV